MPVMKQLRIGSVNYDTVGEASVTQVQTSGTKIATVTIDGTATDLYAPEGGGSGPEPSSTTPLMDGTAAVGTATTYARADHVHPTDTSRVAASVTNANGLTGTITNTGSVKLESVTAAGKTSTVLASGIGSQLTSTDEDSENYAIVEARTTYAKMEAEGTSGTSSVTVEPNGVSIDKLVAPTTSTMPTTKQYVDDGLAAKQATLVSGTNIKTINGTSILGSGDIATPTYTLPTASTSTLGGVKVDGSTITITDGVISSSGGGSVSMEDTEVDAAVEAAWPVVLHTITRQGSATDNSICKYIGLTDPTSLGTYITEAEHETTVYVATGADYALSTPTPHTLVRTDYIGSYRTRVYSFVMPDSDVTVTVYYDD